MAYNILKLYMLDLLFILYKMLLYLKYEYSLNEYNYKFIN